MEFISPLWDLQPTLDLKSVKFLLKIAKYSDSSCKTGKRENRADKKDVLNQYHKLAFFLLKHYSKRKHTAIFYSTKILVFAESNLYRANTHVVNAFLVMHIMNGDGIIQNPKS